LTIPIII